MTDLIIRALKFFDDNRTLEEVAEALSNEGFGEDLIRDFKDNYQIYQNLDSQTKSTVCTLEDACRELLEMGINESKVEGGKRIYQEKICRVEKLSDPKTLRQNVREEWYGGPKVGDRFWSPLQNALESKNWNEDDVQAILEGSTKVISSLHNPASSRFVSKGLVVGYVQSGKTANMTAVISKAADVGFKVIIVLSGLTNALRRQTQERFSHDIVSLNKDRWFKWTDGDRDLHDQAILDNPNSILRGDGSNRHLAVVKKNPSILNRLIKLSKRISDPIKNATPVLVIDDETDQATVNSSRYRDTASTINRQIRELLAEFPRIAFIGYTATPYANILINPQVNDLYPKDFITALKRPVEYFGPERLFGRDLLDVDEDRVPDDGLDMIREIQECEAGQMVPRAREARDEFVMPIKPSLEIAIKYFFLAMAVRHVRGDRQEHATMMIHTTAFANPQTNAVGVIDSFRLVLLQSVRSDDAKLKSNLAELWNEEKAKVRPIDVGKPSLQIVEFEEIWPELEECIDQTKVLAENYQATERLDYSKQGRKYIVIGGNVLARGLTVEGLIVSFFLRHATTYDALMQMGRWFGFRPNHEDLPRVWMSREMRKNFKDLATIEQEIRNDIDNMANQDPPKTPMDFAVRIRTHPSLSVTSRNKMLDARFQNYNYSNIHKQTYKFLNNPEWLEQNWVAGEDLVEAALALGKEFHRERHGFYCREVPVNLLKIFLENYQVHPDHIDLDRESLLGYIDRKVAQGERKIQTWSVVIVSNSRDSAVEDNFRGIGDLNLVNRSRFQTLPEETIDIKALVSRNDYTLDMPGVGGGNRSWNDVYNLRVTHADQPILLLYPINKDSPAPQQRNTGVPPSREDLGACRHVLGMGVMFPDISPTNSEAQAYVFADIPQEDFIDEYPEVPGEDEG